MADDQTKKSIYTPKKASSGKKVRKAQAAKPGRPGRKQVSFGLHGINKIMQTIKKAGLEDDLNKKLGRALFVKMPRTTLVKLKDFIHSKKELKKLSTKSEGCDCDPDDPYCIYL